MPKEIISSLEYGAYKIETNQYDSEIAGKTYDPCDELGEKILEYRLKKLSYIELKKFNINEIMIQYCIVNIGYLLRILNEINIWVRDLEILSIILDVD